MARDNFKASVVKALRDRVAHRCSNPKCRTPTSSPIGGDLKVNNIGTAAHIAAASSGGPRYDPLMTTQDRTSIKNGIWLCTNCSRDIDNDVNFYTVALLEEWKSTAEATAKKEMGKKLPENDDAINQLTTALSGTPQKNFLAQAISNTHIASAEALQTKDNRFSVNSEYMNGTTSFIIEAKETVNIIFKVEKIHSKAFTEKYRDLIEKGKDFEVSTVGISASGSELISQIMQESSSFKINAPKKSVIQKMSLFQESTGIVESLDDVKGEISIGSESCSFEGFSCSDVFRFRYEFSADNELKITKFSISLQFDKWNGKDVRLLPFHEKLLRDFKRLKDGWQLITYLEIDGLEVFRSKGMKLDDMGYVSEILSFLYYTKLCKKISTAFNEDIQFNTEVSYTESDYMALSRLVSDIEKKEGYSQSELNGNTTCELIITNPDEALKIIESKEAISIRLSRDDGESISLFNKVIYLPPVTIEQHPVVLKVIGGCDELKAGDVVTGVFQGSCHCLLDF